MLTIEHLIEGYDKPGTVILLEGNVPFPLPTAKRYGITGDC